MARMNEEMRDSEGVFGALGNTTHTTTQNRPQPMLRSILNNTSFVCFITWVVLGDDETFQDIFRDFSNMASNQPDRLNRRHFRLGEEEREEERE